MGLPRLQERALAVSSLSEREASQLFARWWQRWAPALGLRITGASQLADTAGVVRASLARREHSGDCSTRGRERVRSRSRRRRARHSSHRGAAQRNARRVYGCLRTHAPPLLGDAVAPGPLATLRDEPIARLRRALASGSPLWTHRGPRSTCVALVPPKRAASNGSTEHISNTSPSALAPRRCVTATEPCFVDIEMGKERGTLGVPSSHGERATDWVLFVFPSKLLRICGDLYTVCLPTHHFATIGEFRGARDSEIPDSPWMIAMIRAIEWSFVGVDRTQPFESHPLDRHSAPARMRFFSTRCRMRSRHVVNPNNPLQLVSAGP